MKSRLIICSVIAVLPLTFCFANDSTPADTTFGLSCSELTVKLGMSVAQVQKICGTPTKKESRKKRYGEQTKFEYLHFNEVSLKRSKAKMEFLNDKLVEIEYQIQQKHG